MMQGLQRFLRLLQHLLRQRLSQRQCQLCLMLLCMLHLPLSAQPRLTFSNLMADAGQLSVSKGESRTVEFVCRNAGNQPLVFDHAEASCPCADVKLPDKPLKPGKEAKIKVTFRARDLDDRGVVTNLITVFYSGPGKYTRLRVKAELVE